MKFQISQQPTEEFYKFDKQQNQYQDRMMMKSLKKNIENLYPQFTVVEVLRYNKFKKTIILRRVNKPYILRLYSLEGVNQDKLINKLSKTSNPHIVKFYEASHDADTDQIQDIQISYIVQQKVEKFIIFPQD